jgi:hypothetical protein
MRFVKMLIPVLCVLALVSTALAANNAMGIRDSYRVTFVAPIHVGTVLLPAGNYVVKHTMEGQEHVMVFEPAKGKGPDVKVKCTLVKLNQKAERTETIYALNAANERVLQELVFQGDLAKHVF